MPPSASASENVLQQMVDALSAQRRRPNKKASPPISKGLPGDKPDPHLFKENNWLKNNRTPDHEKSYNFIYTLDDVAGEWFDDIAVSTGCNAIQTLFHAYFSIQGRSIKHLQEMWGDFKPDQNTDDTEVFTSDVKQQPTT